MPVMISPWDWKCLLMTVLLEARPDRFHYIGSVHVHDSVTVCLFANCRMPERNAYCNTTTQHLLRQWVLVVILESLMSCHGRRHKWCDSTLCLSSPHSCVAMHFENDRRSSPLVKFRAIVADFVSDGTHCTCKYFHDMREW